MKKECKYKLSDKGKHGITSLTGNSNSIVIEKRCEVMPLAYDIYRMPIENPSKRSGRSKKKRVFFSPEKISLY